MTLRMSKPSPLSLAIAGLCAATVLVGLTLVGMTSSLPTIVASLGGSQADYATIITGSLLCSALGVPVWGNLADRFDRRVLLQCALVVLVIGSLAAAAAISTPVLIAARCAQGLAVGGIISLTSISVGALVPIDRRSTYLGLIGAVMSTSIAVGPVICGLVTDQLGWRWSFGGIAALALAVALALRFVLTVPRASRSAARFDSLGLLAVALGLGSLLAAVGSLSAPTGLVPPLLPMLLSVFGLLSLTAAVVIERRAALPIVPIRMLRERTVGLASAINVMVSVAIFGVAIFVVQYLQIALGLSVFEASLYLIPQVVGTVISSLGVASIVQRRGSYKWWIFAGVVVSTASLAGLSLVRFGIPALSVAVILFVLGLGMGAVQQNLVLASQGAVGPERLSAATSLVGFFGSLGGLIGASTLATVLQARLVAVAAQRSEDGLPALMRSVPDLASLNEGMRAAVQEVYAEGLGDIFAFTVPVLVVAAVCAAFLPDRRLSSH